MGGTFAASQPEDMVVKCFANNAFKISTQKRETTQLDVDAERLGTSRVVGNEHLWVQRRSSFRERFRRTLLPGRGAGSGAGRTGAGPWGGSALCIVSALQVQVWGLLALVEWELGEPTGAPVLPGSAAVCVLI
ncbi:unnamed protein product [Ostreobium quekettii]|uniref:Uncharacterized protein n=1 Tax=Ostreobium quekettii TaxID=121088 RepID=A0A8S1ITH5_9CHLO|nr:unnamed protein product [Ostreobium quekettii]